MALKGIVEVEGGLLHTHLLYCVHKYTGIHGGIGLLAHKGIVVVERGVLLICISELCS